MKNKSPLIIIIVISFLALFSCSERQDFEQLSDLEVIPDLSGPILFVETTEAIINTISPDTIRQNINFDGFATGVFSDRVIEGYLTFELENSTSKDIRVLIDFLDEANNSLDTVVLNIGAAPPVNSAVTEIFYGTPTGNNIDIIRNTSSLQVSFINISGTTGTAALTDPKLIFRSSASFKLRILE